MDKHLSIRHMARRLSAFFICAMILCFCFFILVSYGEESRERVIRVGCFPYEEQLKKDENGNYSGYGYDYLQEIARYTNWRYEFVDASWNECLSMLEDGEIDLLGAVMRSPEREAIFDYSDYAMISGYGVLATPLDNDILPYEDFQAFDGIRVGVIKGNLHLSKFLDYSHSHTFTPVIQEFDSLADMEEALSKGEIDAIIMTDLLRSQTLRVVATFGENDSYFATTKGNTEVSSQLNEAIRKIRRSDPYFNNKLDQKFYNLQAATAISFTREELDFIKNSPEIPCVYIPETIPISYYDKSTNSVRGVAVDVCGLLEERTGLTFTWLHPKSASEAVAMLSGGKALLLPAKYYDFNWAEQNAVGLSEPYLLGQMVMVTNGRTEKPEVVALYDQGSQSRLVAGLVSSEAKLKQYATIIDCMDAVLNGDADTAFINSTIASYLVNNPKYNQLKTTPLYGYSADIAMAVSDYADPMLLSVLNKGLRNISATDMNQIVLSQMKEGQASAMATYLYLHPVEAVLAVTAVFLVLIFILLFLLYGRLKSARSMQKTLYTDSLTGYPNYRALVKEAPPLIQHNTGQYALVYLDIDQFKVINDTFGYEMGDKVLISTSNTLRSFIEKNERFARVYADTFVLLLKYATKKKLLLRLERLSKELKELSFEYENAINPLFCGGVYPLPDGFSDLDKACDRANYAKDSIAHHFSNTFVFYDDVMRNRVLAEKELENSMLSALDQGQFIPYYQPKVNTITGKVIGAEALVRWLHPEKGCISPAEFLPFYEKNGFIVKIDLAIFEQVCRDLQKMLERGGQVVPVSVNFSRRHMRDTQLPQKLKSIVERYQIPAYLLEVEITETEELENVEIAVDFVDALKAFGFGISIDDYGTGYSSISFLQQLPLDALKLDRKFILNAMKTDKAKDIMLYLVAAMQRNEIRVVCEGVETIAQRDFIVSLNCRFIQGYLYSMPLPQKEFEEYLRQHGTDIAEELEFVNINSLEKVRWIGAEDFLMGAMGSWVISCYLKPGYPVHYISPSFLRGMGYSELEFKVDTEGLYANWMHPDDLLQVMDSLDECRDSVKEMSLRYRLRKKNGEYVRIHEVLKHIVSEDGQEVLLGVCDAVTDTDAGELEYDRFMELVPSGIGRLALTESGPVICQANHRFYEIIGYGQEDLKNQENNLYRICHEEDLPNTKKLMRGFMEKGMYSGECCFRVKQRDGRLHWISFRGNILDGSSEPVKVVGVVEDINRQKRFEYAFQQETQYRKAFTESSLMAYEINLSKDTIQRITGSRGFRLAELCHHLENPENYSEALAASVEVLVAAEDREQFAKELSIDGLMNLYRNGMMEKELEYRRLTLDGQELWNSVLIELVLDQLSGDVMGYAFHRDIHERKEAEQGLVYQACRDSLTGVFNRTMAARLVQGFLLTEADSNALQAFLMLDLDRFKELNDTYGHLIGDKCLVKLSEVVSAYVREDDIIARMGGDEFAILLKNIREESEAVSIAQEIAQAVTRIGGELGLGLNTSVSIGIAFAPRQGTEFESLYRLADEAMYQAKRGTDTCVIFG